MARIFDVCSLLTVGLIGRLVYLMGFRSDYYYEKQEDLHERERDIKAARGKILDAKGKVWRRTKDCMHHFCDTQSDQRSGKSDPPA